MGSALPFLEFYPRAPGGGARRPELPWEAPTESSRWKLPWTAAAGSWRGWRGKPQWEDKQKEEEEEEEEEKEEERAEEVRKEAPAQEEEEEEEKEEEQEEVPPYHYTAIPLYSYTGFSRNPRCTG